MRSVSAGSLVWSVLSSSGLASVLSSHRAELSPAGADKECGVGVMPRPWYWPFGAKALDAASVMASWEHEESRPDLSHSFPAWP